MQLYREGSFMARQDGLSAMAGKQSSLFCDER